MAGTSPAKGAQNPKRRRSRGAGSRANAGVTAAPTLAAGAAAILATAEPTAKIAASRALAEVWAKGAMAVGHATPLTRPARPDRPLLRPPKEMPKRRAFGSTAGRIALLHALAHIELNAVDLGWDIVARFSGEALPRTFFDDWVSVAA